ncbi:dicarboxylate/amino acid:cation symporter [Serpentinicella alkaliphila]|uniref:Na+/H+-dicarboxylate symporter n=1 Tax=Serpentinicella alkaliphila TaxID=1734049 RepID=A0A4R2TB33_9FIRM|nr:dicarboxylate/amino acid:cation symporter [Serpentinicella alkaliphila]QUH26966.1 dicarboxylate/amino acid:cation symporter [Serpentinicella alkaliphila]TCQ00560.1 Na+/H+-dicarboxylate symporter [Serpentinicella alkaliphila]
MANKKNKLTTRILLGLALGLITGVILYNVPSHTIKDDVIIKGVFYIVGQVFLRAIMMMVVPLVFVSIVNGASNMGDIKKIGRIGMKTLVFYLATTAIAISIAIGLASIVNPGLGLDMASIVTKEPTIKDAVPLAEVIVDIIPRNPINAMASGNMLQIIAFALFIGVGLSALGEKVKILSSIFEQLNELMMKLVSFVMELAPVGVFCLIATTFATEGYAIMVPLFKYMITVIVALIIHGVVTYGSLLKVFTGLSPLRFFKQFFPAFSVAFSTASSSATLPVTIETVEDNIGVSKDIASFTLPLGATINMDGTAIMQGVATIFIAQVYGINLGFSEITTVIITATLASIGTAGVPGVGLIMLSMVLQSVGLPVEGIALIMGIDRILDMSRTAINITGDAVCTTVIAKSEGEFDEEIFNSTKELQLA